MDESPVQSMENKENKENKDGGYIHQEYAAGLGWLKHVRSYFNMISAIQLILYFFYFHCSPLMNGDPPIMLQTSDHYPQLADGTCSLECNDGSELRCQAGSKDILLKSDGKTQR